MKYTWSMRPKSTGPNGPARPESPASGNAAAGQPPDCGIDHIELLQGDLKRRGPGDPLEWEAHRTAGQVMHTNRDEDNL